MEEADLVCAVVKETMFKTAWIMSFEKKRTSKRKEHLKVQESTLEEVV